MKAYFLILFLILLLTIPGAVHALSNPCTNTPSSTLCNPITYSQDDVGVFAFKAVSIASTFFFLIAVVFVVFSGFRMVMSQGNEEEITVAKNALLWSVLGLILSMFAFVIIYATGDFIGAKNLNPDSYVGNNVVRNPLMDISFGDLLGTLLKNFLAVLGFLSILMIILGGYRYIASSGNEEQAESGKKTLQWAIAGFIVSLLAYVIVQATLTFFNS